MNRVGNEVPASPLTFDKANVRTVLENMFSMLGVQRMPVVEVASFHEPPLVVAQTKCGRHGGQC